MAIKSHTQPRQPHTQTCQSHTQTCQSHTQTRQSHTQTRQCTGTTIMGCSTMVSQTLNNNMHYAAQHVYTATQHLKGNHSNFPPYAS